MTSTVIAESGAKPMTPLSTKIGWGLSGIAIAFLTMDGVMKIFAPAIVVDTTAQLGWPADRASLLTLAVLLLGSTLLYVIPLTAVLGAILLTGYLGGAVATHVRIASPLLTHELFGVYVGLFVWGGLWLRDPRVRAILPARD